MSNGERKDHDPDMALDRMLSGIPRDVEPSRDLWPNIRAGIEATPMPKRRPALSGFTRLAAGFVLLVATSATTYVVTRQSMQPTVAPNLSAATDGNAIIAEYLRSRADLDRLFAARVATLPAATRAKLENNLADLRRAESEIVASLSQHPSDALLHELLLSTYQSEAQLLADVSDLAITEVPRRKS